MMQCKYCGHDLSPGDAFCGQCGAPCHDYGEDGQPKKGRRPLVIVLVVFLCIAVLSLGAVWALSSRFSEAQEGDGTTVVPSEERTASVALEPEEAATIFGEFLQENEFIGHGVKAYFGQEPYDIGLVYQLGVYADYFETPLVATILLKETDGVASLVRRDDIVSDYNGSFEEPLGSGYYGKTIIDGADAVFIQTNEATFSEYNVVHQVLVDQTGLLDFSEAVWENGSYVEVDGDWYVGFNGRWQMLDLEADAISFTPIDILDFRPAVGADDLVIEINQVEEDTDTPMFTINGEDIPSADFSEDETGMGYHYNSTIPVSAGTKIVLLDHPEISFFHSGYQWDSGEMIPFEEGIGYAVIDTGDLGGDFSVSFYRYVDAFYTFDLTME